MPKQIKLLIVAGLGVIILGWVLFYAQPKDQDHSAMNATVLGKTLNLKLDPQNYDFGTISMKNGLASKSFTVRNDQNQPISLAELYTSCMCTNVKIKIKDIEYGPFGMQGHGAMKMLNQVLGAGEEAQLEVIFDPNAHGPSGIGQIERTITIQSDKGEIASVNIKANVTP